jgi:hypothetical protein
MQDVLELIAEQLSVERLHALRRALETLRDCSKEAMGTYREAGKVKSSELCRGAYQASSHQLLTVDRTLMKKEGD